MSLHYSPFRLACGMVWTLMLSALAFTTVGAAECRAEEIFFADQEKREVRLTEPPKRVVSIVMPMASTLIAFDSSTAKLVGMNPTAKSAVVEGILGKIFPQAKDIPSDVTAPNFIPNVEALTATNPDLVIQWGGRGDDIVAPIVNARLTAMLILYGTEELTREYIDMTARAIGKPERIMESVAWRDRVQADIETKAATIPEDGKPRVLYLQRALSDMATAGSGENYNAQRYKAIDVVIMGRAAGLGLFRRPGATDIAAAHSALGRAGAARFAHEYYDRLSGGERQLVLLARAIATGSSALVLDEPGSAFDRRNQERLLMMPEGEAVYGPVRDTITPHNLERLYGVPMRLVGLEGPAGALPSAVLPAFAGLQHS